MLSVTGGLPNFWLLQSTVYKRTRLRKIMIYGGFPEHYGIFKYCNNIFACFQIRPDGEKASILCEVHRCLFITEEDETC